MVRKPQTEIETSAIDEPSSADESRPSRFKALVFISHDTRDADLAEAFANLLADVSAGTLKSFRSSDKRTSTGIEFGAEWYAAIMTQLGDATDVVALLTPLSLNRPWILYEAGVAKGRLGTTVFGVALGVPLQQVSTGPFGQFQNCGDDEDSLTKLVLQLLSRNPDAAPREEAIRTQVRVFRENVGKIFSSRGGAEVGDVNDSQSAAKLFEEVKAMVREIPSRIEYNIQSRTKPRRRLSRIRPGMFDEMISSSDPNLRRRSIITSWLLLISIMREDFPWLYESGMSVYRSMKGRHKTSVIQNLRSFQHSVLEFQVSPIHHAFVQDEDTEFIVFELPQIVDRFIEYVMEFFPARDKPRGKSDMAPRAAE